MGFDKELLDKYAPEAKCIMPMKIWKLPDNKLGMFSKICQNGDYFGELKKDGYWYQYEKTENHVYLFSRNVSKITGILSEKIDNVPHIKQALDCLPANTILIGEIYYPGKTSKDVTKIMGCLPREAIRRQEKEGYIHYYVHDMIEYNGEDLREKGAFERYSRLKEVFDKYQITQQYEYIELAQAWVDDLEERTASALRDGEEGMVLKRKDYPYVPDKRPAWSTIKIKKKDNIDAVYMGNCPPTHYYVGKEPENWPYKDEEGKLITKDYYYNWPGAIRIGCYDGDNLVEIGTISSGLSDSLKEELANNEKKWYNTVVEIECMEKNNSDHTLRHGFLKRFRDDKNPKDCQLNEIFN